MWMRLGGNIGIFQCKEGEAMALNEKMATEEVEGWASDFLNKVEGEASQKFHGEIFESPADLDQETPFQPLAEKIVVAPDPDADANGTGAILGEKITELLDQIGEGLQADDATNFQKLTIARRYGPMLLELKELVPHGAFEQTLAQRFPKVSRSKCYRWRYLAENEDRVAAALERYPDVAWGPKKMIDFLKGYWSPEAEDEEERFENDEEECSGLVREEESESVLLVTHQVSPAEDAEDVMQRREAPAHAAPKTHAPSSKRRHRPAQPGTAPKSLPDTEAAADQEGTQQVVLTVADNSKVADVREFFEDTRIHHRNNRSDEGQVFTFAGSAADEKKLLGFLANLLGVRGPVKLEITLHRPDEA